MKILFETSKFYPCYPVFLLTWYTVDKQQRLTTLSSSYSLANSITIGVGKESSFAQQVITNGEFCINFLNKEYMYAIEVGGYLSNKAGNNKKTEQSKLSFSDCQTVHAPYINEAEIIFECKIEQIIPLDNILHIIARIESRFCNDYYIENNLFQYHKLDIPLYEGDEQKRVYRYMSEEAIDGGSFLKR